MSPGYSTGLHIRLFPPLACLETLVCPNLWGHPWCRTWSQQQGNPLDKGYIWGFPAAFSGQPKPLCQPTAHTCTLIFSSFFATKEPVPHTLLWNPGQCSSVQQSASSFSVLSQMPGTTLLVSCFHAWMLCSSRASVPWAVQTARADLMSWNSLIAAQAVRLLW